MIARLLLFFSFLSLPALAQLQVLLYDGSTETPVGALVDMGSAAPGDSTELRFRVRNFGAAQVTITTLKIADAATPFKISAAPSLPLPLAPGSAADFRVVFSPTTTGTFNGFLVVNTINVALRGFGVPTATLTLAGSTTPLATGAVIDFGSVVPGSSHVQTLLLTNLGKTSITVAAVSVSGPGFRGPLGATAPIPLAAGQSVSFQIAFEPQSSQQLKGTLLVDQRSFTLAGLGLETLSLTYGSADAPVGAVADMGSATPGDSVETKFRVRNFGTAVVSITTLKIADATTPFKISAAPSLPIQIAAGSFADFRVSFSPPSIGTFNGLLLVNGITAALQGSGVPSATLTLAGGTTPLAAGATIDFGSAQRGASKPLALLLANPGKTSITVPLVSVTGTGFRGPIGVTAPVTLTAGQSVSFQIAFEPQSSQPLKGTLIVDQRSFVLTGLGLDPPLPGASIVFGSQTALSSQQNTISIPLASASAVSGSGTLTLEFHSSVPGVTDDAAIRFVTGAKRNATVNISAGDTIGKFGTQSSIAFQTGTTAGTIVFTLTLPNSTQQASLIVTPAAISFDSATGVRRVNDLDVSLTGFDNTYSASQLAFTFYDKKGATMQPGVIRVDASSDFHLYFASSQVGGAFALLATFPVSGDATQVGSVDVQLANSVGVTKTQRITFP
ncbi:MAG TPA: choice-of-anchor D domain-containing protein [Bryobacteraceae bacterium]|nr:choice-of-anchor D domain-containing protein [Bryobacteraceae bacterium]